MKNWDKENHEAWNQLYNHSHKDVHRDTLVYVECDNDNDNEGDDDGEMLIDVSAVCGHGQNVSLPTIGIHTCYIQYYRQHKYRVGIRTVIN